MLLPDKDGLTEFFGTTAERAAFQTSATDESRLS